VSPGPHYWGLMADGIYASDPAMAPDSGFVSGELRHAVMGNRGRLLDARRTPISITAVIEERAEFQVRIDAFEDTDTQWLMPLWEIGRFQFPPQSPEASASTIEKLQRAIEAFNRPLVIEADADVRPVTLDRIARRRRTARELLSIQNPERVDLEGCVRRRQGDPRLYELLERFLADLDLVDLDRHFCEAMVSNPRSGELVKGHAIVLAQLGLCPYYGTIERDPELFSGSCSAARRSEHLIARLGFSQALWSRGVAPAATLYRAAAGDGPLRHRVPDSFVSCTFSEEVAGAHFAGGPTTQTAVMWRQNVSLDRLLMTFLETRAMNTRFKEAEAVLVADPANPVF
jgi:hypothetical protein